MIRRLVRIPHFVGLGVQCRVLEFEKSLTVADVVERHPELLRGPTVFMRVREGEPQFVLRQDWKTVRIAPWGRCAFVTLPGDDGVNPIALIASLAVMVAAPQFGAWLTTTSFGAAAGTFASATAWNVVAGLGAAAFALGGTFALNAVLPTNSPTASALASAVAGSVYSIQPPGNQSRPGEIIPVQYGTMEFQPDYAAEPYMEYWGNKQRVFLLFCLGQGQYQINYIKVGETKVWEGGTSLDVYDMEIEQVEPGELVTLFPDNVDTSSEVTGQELTYGSWIGPFAGCASGAKANYVGIDIVFPGGLYGINSSTGALTPLSVGIYIDVREIDDNGDPVGDGSWTRLDDKTITLATNTPQRFSYRYPLEEIRFEARVTRYTGEASSSYEVDKVLWSGMRAYLPNQRTYPDDTLLAVVIETDSQIAGVTTTDFKMSATRKIATYDTETSTWTEPVATESIAWALADAAHNPLYGPGLDYSQIDLEALISLHETWTAREDVCNIRFDTKETVWDAFIALARTGRAKPLLAYGVLTWTRDEAQSIYKAMLTPYNIKAGSLTMTATVVQDDAPDGVKVEYFNRQTWAWDHVDCSLSGGSPDRPKTIRLKGVIDHDHAWREGMYEAACLSDRRIAFSANTEMEGLALLAGDAIAIDHDMPFFNQTAEVLTFNSSSLAFGLSEPLTWTFGENHYLRLRRPDGSVWAPDGVIVYHGADEKSLVADAASWAGQIAACGDNPADWINTDRNAGMLTIASFGAGESSLHGCVVASATPQSQTDVQVVAMLDSASVYTADTGTAPTPPSPMQLPGVPTLPVVADVRLSVSWTGDIPVAQISWRPAAAATHYVVEISYDDGDTWASIGSSTVSSLSAVIASGSISVRVAACNGRVRGAWASWSGTVGVPTLPPTTVTGLALRDVYSGANLNAAFQWQASTRASYYDVEIWHSGTRYYDAAVLSNSFDWTQALAAQYGGPWASFLVKIRAANSVDSSDWTELAVSASALPAPANPTYNSISDYVSWDAVVGAAGYLCWLSSTSGFTPSSGLLEYDGADTRTGFTGLVNHTTYYVRVAAYDQFEDKNPANLNLSNEYSFEFVE